MRVDAAPKPKLEPKSTFRLIRYFSITSLVGVLIVVAVLLFFYRYFAFRALENHETRGNVAITRMFANTVWPSYPSYVQSATAIPRAELQQRPEVARLREDVLRQMGGLSIVKVKTLQSRRLDRVLHRPEADRRGQKHESRISDGQSLAG